MALAMMRKRHDDNSAAAAAPGHQAGGDDPAPYAARAGRLPTLAEVSPAYAGFVERRDQFTTERAALQVELGEIGTALATVAPAGDRAARAARIIDGDEAGRTAAELQDRRRACQTRLGDLDIALETLADRISVERMRASAIIRERVAPRHATLVKTMCTVMLVMHEASRAYHEFASELNANQVAWSMLHPMQALWLGDPASRQSPIALYLNEARNHGFITTAEIPEKLRR